jgi:hypothetical protein
MNRVFILAGALLPVCAAHAVPSTVDDRILLGLQGESLTNTNGGGGGSIGWLHNFSAEALAGVGVEHQALANSHWTFGTLNGAYTIGQGGQRYTVFGEAHEGGGNDGKRALNYHVEALGLSGTYFSKLSVTLEDRQFFVDTVSGNLPKLAVSYLWNPHFQTTASYAYSVGSNLGTRLAGAKVDIFETRVKWLLGCAFGQATAVVLLGNNALPGQPDSIPGLRVKEGYVGATVPLSLRSEIALIFDYQKLYSPFVDSKRLQGNLNFVFHVGHHGT